MDLRLPKNGFREGFDLKYPDGRVAQQHDLISYNQSTNFDFLYSRYAEIYYDQNCNPEVDISPSIAGGGGAIFTSDVVGRFMEMAPNARTDPLFNPTGLSQTTPSLASMQPNTGWIHTDQTRPANADFPSSAKAYNTTSVPTAENASSENRIIYRSAGDKDRLELLIHILCELKDTHGVTADKLRRAGQNVRCQIMPADRLQILDEIYYVRQMEERFMDGKIEPNTLLVVTQTHPPGAIYQEHGPSVREHAGPNLASDTECEGRFPGGDRSPSSNYSGPPTIQCHQTLPPSSALDHSMMTGSKADSFSIPPPAISQETLSTSKDMHKDPNYRSDYCSQPFAPEHPWYWPAVAPLSQHPTNSGYGF
ncbi:uncharacterized protein N7498_006836 [Penicillium cinerascens]|uniref:Subtelomeric hrmA-associated cluster protein AFUB-079030/YDR124W-like helical bundle domain-containing protein n=1 Tax=Penicillium cinerascens TaxID=70096 RepID=A0A9W9JJY2_9EURO|nr:uncharacterized protein N7498_006836 [Penicillium cinerascens]KAJ5197719.1 hypothetical protein N7498_006836 [Penicillium cinerascens]